MTIDKLKEYHGRRLFQPFDIRVADGRVRTADHRSSSRGPADGFLRHR